MDTYTSMFYKAGAVNVLNVQQTLQLVAYRGGQNDDGEIANSCASIAFGINCFFFLTLQDINAKVKATKAATNASGRTIARTVLFFSLSLNTGLGFIIAK